MSPVRRRSRAELPSSPIEFAYPIAVPDGTVFGAVIIKEVPHSFALHVFHALRMTMAWAAGPEASGIEFDTMDLWEWEVEVLQTEGVDEALWAPVSVIAGELTRPALLEPERLAHACLAVMDWALGAEAHGTALLFAEAAAVVWPSNARLAWICGKAHRERNDFAGAETWLKRAKRVAVWTGDWDLQALAITSLGNLKVRLGDLATGRELLLSALRLAKRKRLGERQAKASHDLLLVCIYDGRFEDAEKHATQAFTSYGPAHPSIIDLAFDVTVLWNHQGQFARALPVLKALHARFTAADRRLRVLVSTARAAGAVGDTDTFHKAWADAWTLIDSGSVDHLRAAAPLEIGLGALSLGLWEHAEVALTTSRDAAKERREGETLVRAEASLDNLQRRQAADRYSGYPPYRPRPGDLSTNLVKSLNAQAAETSDSPT
jgi:tetratricopeptide (TPR) repeat protein